MIGSGITVTDRALRTLRADPYAHAQIKSVYQANPDSARKHDNSRTQMYMKAQQQESEKLILGRPSS